MWGYLTKSEVYKYFSLYPEKVMFIHEQKYSFLRNI